MYSIIDELSHVNSCNVVYDSDVDFGKLVLLNTCELESDELLPSQKITPEKLAHLSLSQQHQLLNLLDKFSDVFSDRPGLCSIVQHEAKLLPGFTLSDYAPIGYHNNIKGRGVNCPVGELMQRDFIESRFHRILQLDSSVASGSSIEKTGSRWYS
jgi:hypothetical protein